MSTTVKMKCTRFVAQVSSAPARSKSSYLAMMEENLSALKACPWRVAPGGTPVSLTGHDFTAETQYSDAYDAFKLTGNYDSKAMTEIAYAGMVAYRFDVPASAISGSVPLSSVSLPVSRDRFLRSGIHVGVALSDSSTPTSEWSVVRGGAGASSSSVLSQATVANLMAGSAGADVVEVDLSEILTGNPSRYLWVYITLEDYTDAWTMYNSKEKRLYAVEGSAMLSADSATFTFDGVVTPDEEPDEGVAYLANPIPVKVAHFEGYHRTLRPSVCFGLLGVAPAYVPHTSESDGPLPVRSVLLPVASWSVPEGSYELPLSISLQTDNMRIPEGDYILECWLDLDGDGKFTPGDPYGCARAFGLSAAGIPDAVEIELTEQHTSMPRMDLSVMLSALPVSDGGDSSAARPVSGSALASLTGATDRGRWLIPWATVSPASFPSTTGQDGAALLTRIRIVRDLINGVYDADYTEVVFDHYFELDKRAVITEADLLADTILDLDWGTILTAYGGSAGTLLSATYRLVFGDADSALSEDDGQTLPLAFTNTFTGVLWTEPVVPAADMEGAEYAGHPMFKWTQQTSTDRPYNIFQLQFFSDSGKTTKIYDSGPVRAVRDAAGVYSWTAPIAAGDTTGEGVTLASGVTYYWAVVMLDSLHTVGNFGDAAATSFSFS